MFCKNCGNELKEGVAFCGKCGTTITVPAENQAAPTPAPQASYTNENLMPQQSAFNTQTPSGNQAVQLNNKIDRNVYIGKTYEFVHYWLVNLRSFRLSPVRVVGFDEDSLVYAKGFKKSQIPYSCITGIKDEQKVCVKSIVCLCIGVILSLLIGITVNPTVFIVALFSLLYLLGLKERVITITTSDNHVFKLEMCTKNKEADDFLMYLRNETGIM